MLYVHYIRETDQLLHYFLRLLRITDYLFLFSSRSAGWVAGGLIGGVMNHAQEFVMEHLNTKSFPTVNFVKGDKSVVKYESEARKAEDFTKFQKSFEKSTA